MYYHIIDLAVNCRIGMHKWWLKGLIISCHTVQLSNRLSVQQQNGLQASRHTVVCLVWPKKPGARDRQVCILQEWRKHHFHASVAQHTLNKNTQNFLCEFPQAGALPILNLSWIRQTVPEICAFKVHLIFFVFFSPSFRNTFWNCYNSRMLWWIALKFGALLEHIRVYLRFNFCSNGIKL